MIGSLRGTVLARSSAEVLIEVAGIGYRCQITPVTAARLGDDGAEVLLFTHHHIREDAQTLFGFPTDDERQLFEVLLGTHGIGPSLALAILAALTPDELIRAIADDDDGALCLISGVGKKTAARLILELKPKVEVLAASFGGVGSVPAAVEAASSASSSGAMADLRAALGELGYSPEEVRLAAKAVDPNADIGDMLRQALSALAGG